MPIDLTPQIANSDYNNIELHTLPRSIRRPLKEQSQKQKPRANGKRHSLYSRDMSHHKKPGLKERLFGNRKNSKGSHFLFSLFSLCYVMSSFPHYVRSLGTLASYVGSQMKFLSTFHFIVQLFLWTLFVFSFFFPGFFLWFICLGQLAARSFHSFNSKHLNKAEKCMFYELFLFFFFFKQTWE